MMKTKGSRAAAMAVALVGLTMILLATLSSGAWGSTDPAKMRWDIIQLSRDAATGKILLSPGGTASALAQDGSQISITGSGTFLTKPGVPGAVTGGGTWETSGPVGSASGTYTVTGFVGFQVAPGTVPSTTFVDGITGKIENARSGLTFLRIAYSDGSTGVLVVSCHLPAGAPDSIFEGITASKGFVDFWNNQAPFGTPDGANGNRTQFHVI